ncbi:MAG: helicase C-terminal domain-containing protein [Anaeroplasmataceae bacterium]
MKRLLAVREIAYFLYSSGDLSADFFSNASAIDGKKAHQYIQRQYKEDDIKEYYIKSNIIYKEDEITIHGYIDGVINEDGKIVLEEIKSTKKNLNSIDINYHQEHLAQLMLYAYMYGDINELDYVNVRLTYIKIGEYKTKSFPITYSMEELKNFFYDSIDKYLDWLYILDESSKLKLSSINDIKFPFPKMREGQYDLIKASYYTLSHNDILYSIAPTGIGKTMATLFSGLKSLTNYDDKLFYLTSKNIQKNICIDSVNLLTSKGLKIKTLELTSKAKSCLNETKICDPMKCIYASGFFNRLKDAFRYIYDNYDTYTSDIILEVSKKYKICPFEFSLYISYYCDLIICDYNYVFDPKAHLIRYFDDDTYKPKILIDEAHNLVSRSKDMYSANILFSDIKLLGEILSPYNKILYKIVDDVYDKLINLDIKEYNEYYSKVLDDGFINSLYRLKSAVEDILDSEEEISDRNQALLLYFNLKDFLDNSEYYSESHIFIVNKLNNDYEAQIICLDASDFIYKTIKTKCHGVVFFSATLYPINYYMDLLTKGNGKYLTLESPFNHDNLNLVLNTSISTKYKDREKTINSIIDIVDTLVNAKKGNHIIFFPSYKYMELFINNIDMNKYNLVIQYPDMSEAMRLSMFESFKEVGVPHLGLFVLGGVFSEGIDFKDDLLNGVIVVGVGIPQINLVNNLIKEYFDEKYDSGYDYAYTYPGINKVIQASGRVIRSEYDRGSVILIDERYKQPQYQALFPRHWSNKKIINSLEGLKRNLNDFYKHTGNMSIDENK